MGDRYFGDPRAGPTRVYWNKAMHFTIEFHAGERFAPICLQAAAVIVKVNTTQCRDQSVRDARWQAPCQQSVFSVLAPPRYYVVAFVELVEQAAYISRIILEIGVHRNKYRSASV